MIGHAPLFAIASVSNAPEVSQWNVQTPGCEQAKSDRPMSDVAARIEPSELSTVAPPNWLPSPPRAVALPQIPEFGSQEKR